MPSKVLANFCARHNFLVINLSPKSLVVYYSSVCRVARRPGSAGIVPDLTNCPGSCLVSRVRKIEKFSRFNS